MECAFIAVKNALRQIRRVLPNYCKVFMLRTDASNLGAVDEKSSEWRPVQWASNKLTQTERRYVISENVMLAIFWE